MKDGGGSGGGVYVPPIPRLRSVIASLANGNVTTASRSYDCDWRDGREVSVEPPMASSGSGYFRQQRLPYSRYVFGEWSEDDSDRDIDPPLAFSKHFPIPPIREKCWFPNTKKRRRTNVIMSNLQRQLREWAYTAANMRI